MSKIKKFIKYPFLAGLAVVILVVISDRYVSSYSTFASNQLENVHDSTVGVVLGTSKYTINGQQNLFYKNRIQATVDLYSSCKIEKILVSGDNSTQSYNEPRMMYQDLVHAGIPAEDIFLDYAGFRTFDSVIRAHKVFNQSSFVVISQRFHNERALFIARNNGIEAYGYNAKEVPFGLSPKTYVREKLARVKAVLDVYILGTAPKFLGKAEVIS